LSSPFIHPTARVDHTASVGDDTFVWDWATIREGAHVGARCRIGQAVYIDRGVDLGDDCKVQNNALVYAGVTIGSRVFIGPAVTFTNDRVPRAVGEWEIVPTLVDDDASIGANATVICGVRLGKACMVGAGAVVTRDVVSHGLVVGNPARLVDYVDLRGARLHRDLSKPLPAHLLEHE
jgi:acetyltransferase-like isoleucine patch superfamily enzyme